MSTRTLVDDPLAAHLEALEERLLLPAIRANPAAVSALLTEGFLEFGSSGRVWTRDQILEALTMEPAHVITLSAFKCQRLAETVALVTYQSHRHQADGSVVTAMRCSLWLRERDATWRMHFHQGTRVAP